MIMNDWAKLKADAQNTLDDIDVNRLTKSSYTLLGASLAILDHAPDTSTEKQGAAPERTPTYYADDELNSARDYHGKGLDWIARDELKHAGYWISQLTRDEQREYQARYDELIREIGKPIESDGILDDFSVILSRYANSRSKTDRDAMRETLKKQLAEIERELVEMRHVVHDPEAVQMFVDFRESMRLKL